VNLNTHVNGALAAGVLMVLIGACGMTPAINGTAYLTFWSAFFGVGWFMLLLALIDRVRGHQ